MRSRCVRLALVFFVALTLDGFAQLEVNAGYSHLSGNFGLDGFHAGVAYPFTRHVTLVGDADFVWDNSRIGAFDLSPTLAAIRIKSNEQNYLGGARIRIRGWRPLKELERRRLLPFGEILFGVSRLNQKVTNVQTGVEDLDASDQAFTWVVGGGVDYTLHRRWLARGSLDFVRTHFVDEGQSRLRVKVGLAYSF